MSVYFMADGQDDAVKIGYSSDPEQRIHNIQTGNPREIIYLGCIDGNEEVEAALHSEFEEHHIRGEWYFLSDSVRERLRELGIASPPKQSHEYENVSLGFLSRYNAVLQEQVQLLLEAKRELEHRIDVTSKIIEANSDPGITDVSDEVLHLIKWGKR